MALKQKTRLSQKQKRNS